MMDTYLEPLDTRETLSGVEICEDLAACLIEGLRNNADLRPTDAFTGYAAKVNIELQLVDVDTTTVSQTIAIGAFDLGKPTYTAEVVAPLADASQVRERSELPEPTFEKDASALPAKPRRWYTPRAPRSKSS